MPMEKGVGKLGNHTYHLVDPWNNSLRKDHMVVAQILSPKWDDEIPNN